MNILSRTSNNINIATFWENESLRKYNYSPAYQREGDVWSESDKSYLIDTVLKNFPMPPIFLHQHIDTETGKTIYDVIDGKQRLSAIIGFLKNEISIPEDFSNDGFGDSRLEGLLFSDLDEEGLTDWKKNLWKYEITIEYVETDDLSVVNHIFDRLNRNGEPLTNQELRKAKYGETLFYKLISEISNHAIFGDITEKLKSNRLENHEFISELLFLVSEDSVIAGDRPNQIDERYQSYSEKSEADINIIIDQFSDVEKVFESFDIQFEDSRFYGVSHVFGLWGLAWKLNSEGVKINNIGLLLSNFYNAYKEKNDENNDVREYRTTMKAGTKNANQRRKRISSLYSYVTNAEQGNAI